MILASPSLAALQGFAADVCVIGSGPVGIATALALAAKGFRVLVLESGGQGRRARRRGSGAGGEPAPRQPFRAAHRRRPPARRQLQPLGRALRAVRPDRFPRPAVARAAGLAGHRRRARAVPRPGARRARRRRPGLRRAARARRRPGVPQRHARALEQRAENPEAPRPGARRRGRTSWWRCRPRCSASATPPTAGSTALELHLEEGRGELPVSRVILAAGGNASTRLLLLEQARDPRRFGGTDGPLGRFYMGHLSGQIADIVFKDDPAARRARLPCRRPRLLRAPPAGGERGDAGRRSGSPTSPSGRWCRAIADAGAPLRAAVGGVPGALGRAARPAADRRAGAAEARRPAALPPGRAPAQRRSATCRAPSASRPPSSGRTGWRACGCPASS